MPWLDNHRDAALLVMEPVKITNTQFDRFVLKNLGGEGDYLFLVSPLRRAHGVVQTVPGLLFPVFAATPKQAVSVAALASRALMLDGPGELVTLCVQEVVRWEPSERGPSFADFMGVGA